MHNTYICRILGGITRENVSAKTNAKTNESSDVEVTLDGGNRLGKLFHGWVDIAVDGINIVTWKDLQCTDVKIEMVVRIYLKNGK